MLARSASGFGTIALAGLLGDDLLAADATGLQQLGTHHVPRARNVIFLYMDGGPSQVDTFDPKPMLNRMNGQSFPMQMEATQFNDNGLILKSPWAFNRHGECGHPVSELFPNVASCADEAQ